MLDVVFSEAIRNYATAIAVMAGAILAIWKWGFEERLRQKREMVALDGNLSAAVVPLDEEKVVVTLEAVWRNRGSFSIDLVAGGSYVVFTEIEKDSAIGPVEDGEKDEKSEEGTPLFAHGYVMEPNTNSVMHKSFIMPRSRVFHFKWVIGLAPKHSRDLGRGVGWQCTRELVVATSIEE